MSRKILSILLIFIAMLSACSEQDAAPHQADEMTPAAQNNSLPSAVAVLETATPFQANPARPTASPPCSYPASGDCQPPPAVAQAGYPAAVASSPTTTPSSNALMPLAGAFQDCARTPGLVTCDPQAAPLPGTVAFVDGQVNRLVSIDLSTGTGWQAPNLLADPQWPVTRLDWSPNGDQLLVSLGGDQYKRFDHSGNLLETFTSEVPPRWQPDGHLSLDSSVASASGQSARLEQAPDTSWALRVTLQPGGSEQVLPVSAPTDQLFQLLAWAPGTNQLLAQKYYASNAAMLLGGSLIVIDAETGGIRDLNATAPLSMQRGFAWNPQAPTRLAFLQTGGQQAGGQTLGLLDVATGQVRNPLPNMVTVQDLAWSANGERLVFSAAPSEAASTEVRQVFRAAGVYLLNAQTGEVTPVFQTPAGASDGFLHWLSDGQTLLYGRAVDSGQTTRVEFHARALNQDGSTVGEPETSDRILIDGILTAAAPLDANFWSSCLAFYD